MHGFKLLKIKVLYLLNILDLYWLFISNINDIHTQERVNIIAYDNVIV